MVEFDENLNPIQEGQPTQPTQPTEPVQPIADPAPWQNQPAPEPVQPEPVQPEPTPLPVDNFVATPPPVETKAEVKSKPIIEKTKKQPYQSHTTAFVAMFFMILAITAVAIVSIVSNNNSSFVISSGTPEGLTVTATGIIDAIPDVAKVTFGITHKASTVSEVEDKINETFDDIDEALKEFRIKDADIKTSNYRIYPEYDYRSKDRRITGYTGTHQQTITIRDLDDVNKIVDAVTDAGANMISNVNFTVDDSDEWNSRAQAEAIKKAKAKAKLIADEAGINLGKILSIDQGNSYPQPYYREVSIDSGFDGDGDEEILPDIEPGSQELRATVTLVFEIK